MKFETLITRYKNLGYEPKGFEKEIELEFLILWIYKKYDIWINVMYNDHNHIQAFKKMVPDIDVFIAIKVMNCSTEYANKFYSDKYFKKPFDAKFDMVRESYRGIKFHYH